MAEFDGLRKHEKTRHVLYNSSGLGSATLLQQATRISYGKMKRKEKQKAVHFRRDALQLKRDGVVPAQERRTHTLMSAAAIDIIIVLIYIILYILDVLRLVNREGG